MCDYEKYTNDGRFERFVARDRANHKVFYHAIQGGLEGDEVNYVRVDESLNVDIFETTNYNHKNDRFDLGRQWNVGVTWT